MHGAACWRYGVSLCGDSVAIDSTKNSYFVVFLDFKLCGFWNGRACWMMTKRSEFSFVLVLSLAEWKLLG